MKTVPALYERGFGDHSERLGRLHDISRPRRIDGALYALALQGQRGQHALFSITLAKTYYFRQRVGDSIACSNC